MLNPFPSLLIYSFFVPMLLRFVAACVFFYIARYYVVNRRTIASTKLPFVGTPGMWMIWLSVIIIAGTGLALLVGAYTQVAAIVGMLTALKLGVWIRRFPNIIPLSRSTYVLLFAICLSLLITGAGAHAFDVPL